MNALGIIGATVAYRELKKDESYLNRLMLFRDQIYHEYISGWVERIKSGKEPAIDEKEVEMMPGVKINTALNGYFCYVSYGKILSLNEQLMLYAEPTITLINESENTYRIEAIAALMMLDGNPVCPVIDKDENELPNFLGQGWHNDIMASIKATEKFNVKNLKDPFVLEPGEKTILHMPKGFYVILDKNDPDNNLTQYYYTDRIITSASESAYKGWVKTNKPAIFSNIETAAVTILWNYAADDPKQKRFNRMLQIGLPGTLAIDYAKNGSSYHFSIDVAEILENIDWGQVFGGLIIGFIPIIGPIYEFLSSQDLAEFLDPGKAEAGKEAYENWTKVMRALYES